MNLLVEQIRDEFDTIIVPARDEGFRKHFIKENCWFAVRISEKNISKIKYIAAYQVVPIGAITHIAEVDSIEPYNSTNKYILKFKNSAVEIGPIKKGKGSRVSIQAPRFTLREKLFSAKEIDDIWPHSKKARLF